MLLDTWLDRLAHHLNTDCDSHAVELTVSLVNCGGVFGRMAHFMRTVFLTKQSFRH